MVRGLPIYDGASISDRCGRNSLVSVESEVTGAAGSVELGETPCIKDVKRDAAAEPAVGRGLQTPPPLSHHHHRHHPGSHGNPSKLPIEILWRKKRKVSPLPPNPGFATGEMQYASRMNRVNQWRILRGTEVG
jgi:hypothetical protein